MKNEQEVIIIRSKSSSPAKNSTTMKRKTSQVFSPEREYDHFFKVHFIGNSGVGKSALLRRWTENAYDDNYVKNNFSNGFDFKFKTLTIEESTVKIQVYDVAHTFDTDTVNFYRGALAVIVAFDLTDRESFEEIEELIKKEIRKAESCANIVLVGTKCDAPDLRVVDFEAIDKFISKFNQSNASNTKIEAYIETSAKTGENIQALFETVAKCVLKIMAPEKHKAPLQKKQPLQKDALSPRELLIAALEKYIARIERHMNRKAMNEPDFAHGFWHHKQSRAANREANYYLAKYLLERLQETRDLIELIFDDIDGKRRDVILEKNIQLRPYYKNRGINSSELNDIIADASRYARLEKTLTASLNS